jgi:hypothetical protein
MGGELALLGAVDGTRLDNVSVIVDVAADLLLSAGPDFLPKKPLS